MRKRHWPRTVRTWSALRLRANVNCATLIRHIRFTSHKAISHFAPTKSTCLNLTSLGHLVAHSLLCGGGGAFGAFRSFLHKVWIKLDLSKPYQNRNFNLLLISFHGRLTLHTDGFFPLPTRRSGQKQNIHFGPQLPRRNVTHRHSFIFLTKQLVQKLHSTLSNINPKGWFRSGSCMKHILFDVANLKQPVLWLLTISEFSLENFELQLFNFDPGSDQWNFSRSCPVFLSPWISNFETTKKKKKTSRDAKVIYPHGP